MDKIKFGNGLMVGVFILMLLFVKLNFFIFVLYFSFIIFLIKYKRIKVDI